jgi:hypothetical protein
MDGSTLFYIVFGAAVVAIPTILADRLLKNRLPDWARMVPGLLVAALAGLILALLGRTLGVWVPTHAAPET